jgi:hypothetical protein
MWLSFLPDFQVSWDMNFFELALQLLLLPQLCHQDHEVVDGQLLAGLVCNQGKI